MLLNFFVRCCGFGDGVDIRLGCSNGIISASGPIRVRRMGKKKRPFIEPITSTLSSIQKKCRTINSIGDVESMKTASIDVIVP